MILKKEFYFVRHGQTDHNLSDGIHKEDHPEDISLNETGRNQAELIKSIISFLPIKTVCSSPLKRAQQTKEIITANLPKATHYINDNLGECSAQIWREMTALGINSPLPTKGLAHQFMQKVRNGINEVLSLPNPSLIIAHGGVHFAICCLMGIHDHGWIIKNCIPVHFSIEENGKWVAKKLTPNF